MNIGEFKDCVTEIRSLPRATVVIDGLEMVVRVYPADETFGDRCGERDVMFIIAEQSPDVQAYFDGVQTMQQLYIRMTGMEGELETRFTTRSVPVDSIVFGKYLDTVHHD